MNSIYSLFFGGLLCDLMMTIGCSRVKWSPTVLVLNIWIMADDDGDCDDGDVDDGDG